MLIICLELKSILNVWHAKYVKYVKYAKYLALISKSKISLIIIIT